MRFMPSTTQCPIGPACPTGPAPAEKNLGLTRRSGQVPDDNTDVGDGASAPDGPGTELLAVYDEALPHVYGYLLSRCGTVALAEDLTAETLLAAVDAVRRPDPPRVSVPWLVGVARHKLIDHWRRQAARSAACAPWLRRRRRSRTLGRALDALRAPGTPSTPRRRCTAPCSPCATSTTCPCADVAAHVSRSVHATEGLLVRRRPFRRIYCAGEDDDA